MARYTASASTPPEVEQTPAHASFQQAAIGPLSSAFEALASVIGSLPEPLIAAAAAMAAFAFAAKGLNLGALSVSVMTTNIKGLASSVLGLAAAHPVLAGLAVAIGAAAAAYTVLTAKQREIDANTKAATEALNDYTTAAIESGDASTMAGLAVDALSNYFAVASADADKVVAALARIGGSAEDAFGVINAIATDPIVAMTQLAESLGLTTEQAVLLAEAVASTDDQFGKGDWINNARNEITDLYDAFGAGKGADLPFHVQTLIASLEELEDQGENMNVGEAILGDMVKLVGGSKEGQQAFQDLRLTWEALEDLAADHPDILLSVYQDYLDYLASVVAGSAGLDQVSAAERSRLDQLAQEYVDSSGMIRMSTEENEAALAAMGEEAAAAFAEAVAGAAEYRDILESTDWGAAGAQAALTVLDRQRDSLFGLARIATNYQESVDSLKESLKADGGGFTRDGLFDLTTDAGQASQKALEDMSESLDAYMVSAFESSGGSVEKFQADVAGRLAQLVTDLGLGVEAAGHLAEALGLTPEQVATTYELMGAEEAMQQWAMLQTIAQGLLDEETLVKIGLQIAQGDWEGVIDTAVTGLEERQIEIDVEAVMKTVEAESALAELTEQERTSTIAAVADTLEATGALQLLSEEDRTAMIAAVAETLAAQGDLDGMTEEQRTAAIAAVAEVVEAQTDIEGVAAEMYAAQIVADVNTDNAVDGISTLTTTSYEVAMDLMPNPEPVTTTIDGITTTVYEVPVSMALGEDAVTPLLDGYTMETFNAAVDVAVGLDTATTTLTDLKTKVHKVQVTTGLDPLPVIDGLTKLTDSKGWLVQINSEVDTLPTWSALGEVVDWDWVVPVTTDPDTSDSTAAMEDVTTASWVATVLGIGDASDAEATLGNLGPYGTDIIGWYAKTNGIPSSFNIPVYGNYMGTSGGPAGSGADGAILRALDGLITQSFAFGGFPAQAVIQQAVSPHGLFQWAEPSTEGEAFIPLARSKRKRSLELWLEVGRLLGAISFADGGMFPQAGGSLPASLLAQTSYNPSAVTVETGETTLVKVENLTVNEQSDIDILVGRLALAYRRRR